MNRSVMGKDETDGLKVGFRALMCARSGAAMQMFR